MKQTLKVLGAFALLTCLFWSVSQNSFAKSRGVRVITVQDPTGHQVGLYKESHALIIGVSDYTAGWPDLPGVEEDVKEVKKSLENLGFSVTTVMNPTRVDLVKSLEDFVIAYGQEENNRLLIYFAGHGHTLQPKYGGVDMGYIVPTNAPNPNEDEKEFRRLALSMQYIEVYARNIQSKHALFLFDSCFSGSIFAMSRAIPEIIKEKTAKPVRQFITAGTAEQTVPDKSIFRRQFVAAMQGEADSNKDGYITASELGLFLESTVTNYSRRSQTPQYGKLRDPVLDKGDFVFPLNFAEVPVGDGGMDANGSSAEPLLRSAEGVSTLDKIARAREESELERLLREAEERETKIKKQFALLEKLEDKNDTLVPPSDKLKAWEDFVSKFPDRNPKLNDARKKIKYWKQKAKDLEIREQYDKLLVMAKKDDSLISREKKRGAWKDFISQYPTNNPYLFKAKQELARLKPDTNSDQPAQAVDVSRSTPPASSTTGAGAKKNIEGMVMVSGGTFKMGATGYGEDEQPVHTIALEDFYIDVYEVTQNDFIRAMKENPSKFRGGERPVDSVTWHQASAFCRKMGKRLPTEAEWEFAARAGTNTPYYWGNDINGSYAWYEENSGKQSQSVGKKQPNPIGLYDMSGNVSEWVSDWYQEKYYSSSPNKSPKGPASGVNKVFRGGAWSSEKPQLRSTYRDAYNPEAGNYDVGFRCAVSAKDSASVVVQK